MRCNAIVGVGAAAVWLMAAPPGLAQQQSKEQQQTPKQQSGTAGDPQQTQTRTTTAERVDLDAIEENPKRYFGRTVTVQGEVDAVLGPRVFKIDERNWADLDGEILVVMTAPLAAFIDDDEPVIGTGTLRPFVRTELEREWGFLGLDPQIEIEFKGRPVLVASSLVSADGNMVLGIAPVSTGTPQATGTTGRLAGKSRSDMGAAVTDVKVLAEAQDATMIGRRAMLSSIKVQRVDDDGGFWVAGPSDERLYILPVDKGKVGVKAGQTVSIDGYVLRLPQQLEQRLENDPKVKNEEIYVYAVTVK